MDMLDRIERLELEKEYLLDRLTESNYCIHKELLKQNVSKDLVQTRILEDIEEHFDESSSDEKLTKKIDKVSHQIDDEVPVKLKDIFSILNEEVEGWTKSCGFSAGFVNRVNEVTEPNKLSEEELLKIITEEENND